MTAAWHLVTGEYPPAPGGVSDYTAAVARGLADAGAAVHVWCPDASGDRADPANVAVHRVAGQWRGRDLAAIDRSLDETPAPRRLLVQWVPHAYGARSLNLGFCRWVGRRSRRGDIVDLMVHEPALAFHEGSLRQDAAGVVHRAMLATLLRAARKVWVAIPAWTERLRPWAFGRPLRYCWLPVPSSVPLADNPAAVAAMRARYGRGAAVVVGHFGTYGRHSIADLSAIIPRLLAGLPDAGVLLLGRGGHQASEIVSTGGIGARVAAAGGLDAASLSCALQACDLLIQPYPDGASTRRTTLMAALAHGVPVVTTVGRLSEAFWSDSPIVTTVPAGDLERLADEAISLARDAGRRAAQAAAGREEYRRRFEISHTVAALLADSCGTT